jgi:hypothetical protein
MPLQLQLKLTKCVHDQMGLFHVQVALIIDLAPTPQLPPRPLSLPYRRSPDPKPASFFQSAIANPLPLLPTAYFFADTQLH